MRVIATALALPVLSAILGAVWVIARDCWNTQSLDDSGIAVILLGAAVTYGYVLVLIWT